MVVEKSALPVSYDGAGPHASLAVCGPGDRRGLHRSGASIGVLDQAHLGIAAPAGQALPAPSYRYPLTGRIELQRTGDVNEAYLSNDVGGGNNCQSGVGRVRVKDTVSGQGQSSSGAAPSALQR